MEQCATVPTLVYRMEVKRNGLGIVTLSNMKAFKLPSKECMGRLSLNLSLQMGKFLEQEQALMHRKYRDNAFTDWEGLTGTLTNIIRR